MLRAEAEKLYLPGSWAIGGAGSLWGTYVIEVTEIFGKPWRLRGKVVAVMSFPVQGMAVNSHRFIARRPFEFGRLVDFGGANVEPYEGEPPDYNASVINSIDQAIKDIKRAVEGAKEFGKDYGWAVRWLEALHQHKKEFDAAHSNQKRNYRLS